MAAGDVYEGQTNTLSNGSSVSIQPSSGVEVVIHNIYYSGKVEFYKTDGSTDILFDSDAAAGARLAGMWHCTNAKYIKVKNVSGGNINVAFDGIQTK